MRARSKFLSISIIFLIFISFNLNFAQTQQSQKKAERKNMMRAFLEKHNFNLKIVWNKFTATPEVIYGNRISGYSGTPRQIATGFLRDEKGMLGIEDVNQNLSLERTEFSDNGATILSFKQIYKGVPVLASGFLVAVGNDGSIYYLCGRYLPEIDINPVPRLISSDVLNSVARYFTQKARWR